MRAHIFLTISKSGVVKMTKEKPSLSPQQRAVRLTLTIPDSAFAAPPMLDAELTVPADRLLQPQFDEPIAVEIWEDQ
jgi:hypothetical protein